jgi:hypothetical protein
MTVLPASAKAPGVPARTGEVPVTETLRGKKKPKLVELRLNIMMLSRLLSLIFEIKILPDRQQPEPAG